MNGIPANHGFPGSEIIQLDGCSYLGIRQCIEYIFPKGRVAKIIDAKSDIWSDLHTDIFHATASVHVKQVGQKLQSGKIGRFRKPVGTAQLYDFGAGPSMMLSMLMSLMMTGQTHTVELVALVMAGLIDQVCLHVDCFQIALELEASTYVLKSENRGNGAHFDMDQIWGSAFQYSSFCKAIRKSWYGLVELFKTTPIMKSTIETPKVSDFIIACLLAQKTHMRNVPKTDRDTLLKFGQSMVVKLEVHLSACVKSGKFNGDFNMAPYRSGRKRRCPIGPNKKRRAKPYKQSVVKLTTRTFKDPTR